MLSGYFNTLYLEKKISRKPAVLLNELPTEILCKILFGSDITDLPNLAGTCKPFQDIIEPNINKIKFIQWQSDELKKLQDNIKKFNRQLVISGIVKEYFLADDYTTRVMIQT